MQLYDVRAMTEEVIRLGDLSAKCCERVEHAVSLLSKLSRHDVAEAAIKTCEEIDKLESDADRVMRSAMSKLFREETDVRELIKLKAIYEQLESISDRCEDVANLIEGIAEATASIVKVFSGALSDALNRRKLLAVVGYGLSALTKPLFPLATSALPVLGDPRARVVTVVFAGQSALLASQAMSHK